MGGIREQVNEWKGVRGEGGKGVQVSLGNGREGTGE